MGQTSCTAGAVHSRFDGPFDAALAEVHPAARRHRSISAGGFLIVAYCAVSCGGIADADGVMAGWCEPVASGIRVTVQVTPNARKTEVVGVLGDTLKIRLQAQPIEGRANDALLAYLSAMLGVPGAAGARRRGRAGGRGGGGGAAARL